MVIRQNLQMLFFFFYLSPLHYADTLTALRIGCGSGLGWGGWGGGWGEENRSVTPSLTAVASYFPLHFSALSSLFTFYLFLRRCRRLPPPSHPPQPFLILPSLAVPRLPFSHFCKSLTGKSRRLLPLSLSLSFSVSFCPPFPSPVLPHSFISCLPHLFSGRARVLEWGIEVGLGCHGAR